MLRVKTKDNPLEMKLRSALHRRGVCFRKHRKELPGTLDQGITTFEEAQKRVYIEDEAEELASF